MKWLYVGLGNPGPKYQFSRHNFGFLVLDLWTKKRGVSFGCGPFNTEIALVDEEVLALKPLTYMNLSGKAVALLARDLEISPEKILIIHDDLDLHLGRLKFVPKGGAGGHRGVHSIIEALNTKEFPRLKLGIGRPQQGISVQEYVLSPFTEEEWPLVEKVVQRAIKALDFLLQEGLAKTMSIFNRTTSTEQLEKDLAKFRNFG